MQARTLISKTRLRFRDGLTGLRGLVTPAQVRALTDNVFHCCVHKTGSQWIKRILGDPDIFRISGLRTYEYQADMPGKYDPRPVDRRSFSHPFPSRTIVSPIYIDYINYLNIPKPPSTRAFFVTRDPRDVVVSWYFSQRYSHGLVGTMGEVRGMLSDLDLADGLLYSTRHLDAFGVFSAQRSWLDSTEDPASLVIRFENLISSDSHRWFTALFAHCGFAIDDDLLERILARYAFEKLSGRKQGTEDVYTHFRKGIAGDWRNYFNERVLEKFYEITGDLVSRLGYELA